MSTVRSLLFSGALVLSALAFTGQEAQARTPTCSQPGGLCSQICGDPGNRGCTYADCGSGTELCTSRDGGGTLVEA